MHIRFSCRSCRVRLTAEPRLAGAPMVCPMCRAEMLVPSATEPRRANDTFAAASPPGSLVTWSVKDEGSTAMAAMRHMAKGDFSRRRKGLAVSGALCCALALVVFSFAKWVKSSKPDGHLPEIPVNEIVNSNLQASEDALATSDNPAEPKISEVATEQPTATSVIEASLPEEDSKPEAQPNPTNRPAEMRMKRLQRRTEAELRQELARASEVPRITRGMASAVVGDHVKVFQLRGEVPANVDLEPTLLLRNRPDLRQLPIRFGSECRLNPLAAANLASLSNKLRVHLNVNAPRGDSDQRADPVLLERILMEERAGTRPEWLRAGAIPALTQLLMHEDEPIRCMLVELLDKIPEPAATVALAQRAVFDLSPKVREAALRALATRPRTDARPVLLSGLSYPWVAAAEHAAEALVALNDQDCVSELRALMHQPDPRTPIPLGKKDIHGVRQLVRIHHVSNCLMCHPPATTVVDAVIGVQPNSSGILPSSITANLPRGAHDYRSRRPSSQAPPPPPGPPLLIRGDVTYLRQDFAVSLYTDVAGGPRERFDYLVHMTPISGKRLEAHRVKLANLRTYPQKEAVRFAFLELTGKDPSTAAAEVVALSGSD